MIFWVCAVILCLIFAGVIACFRENPYDTHYFNCPPEPIPIIYAQEKALFMNFILFGHFVIRKDDICYFQLEEIITPVTEDKWYLHLFVQCKCEGNNTRKITKVFFDYNEAIVFLEKLGI